MHGDYFDNPVYVANLPAGEPFDAEPLPLPWGEEQQADAGTAPQPSVADATAAAAQAVANANRTGPAVLKQPGQPDAVPFDDEPLPLPQ